MFKTEGWFADADLQRLDGRYTRVFDPGTLGYATVRDYCDSFDHIRPLATCNLDLKDVQRPWMLKAILGKVPRGGRVLEIGAGEPFVADLLTRLGYEVWIVDPYDGSGNGPVHFVQYSSECPAIHFVRDQFSERLEQLSPASFDCIYSISVLEHVGVAGIHSVTQGTNRFLRPDGIAIHAVDHVHRGAGDREHLEVLSCLVTCCGFPIGQLAETLKKMDQDIETYYLSAESHNRWRGGVPYEQFPMRICVGLQIVAAAREIAVR
jgi:SAM-dependent methyltransferase